MVPPLLMKTVLVKMLEGKVAPYKCMTLGASDAL